MTETPHRGRAREMVDKAIDNVRKAMRSFSRDKKRTKSKKRSPKPDRNNTQILASLPTYTAQQWRDSAKSEADLRALGQAEKLLKDLNERGCNITGNVQILERKCYGGFSDIYTGMLRNKKVAIKVPRMNEVDQAKLVRKLMRELRVWFDLKHPNVLPFRGFILGSQDSLCPLFVTDWMENGSLQDFIKKGGCIDKLEMIEGITNGLKYLHERNIVHGDIKAGNVIISPEGIPMLTDFGISHLLVSSATKETATGASKGTVRWLAPELFNSEVDDGKNEHTQASDIWALGMTYLEILTGKAPYANLSDIQVLLAIVEGRKPDMPVDINSWSVVELRLYKLYFERCCAKIPESRSKTADLIRSIAEIRRAGNAPVQADKALDTFVVPSNIEPSSARTRGHPTRMVYGVPAYSNSSELMGLFEKHERRLYNVTITRAFT